MRLNTLLLFSSVFLALFIACLALQETSSATAEARHIAAEKYFDEENWPMAIKEYTLEAKIYEMDAVAFQQNNDVANAIEAYKNAAAVYGQVAEAAQNANLLMEAIKAYKREARMYKNGAQLYRQTSNMEEETLYHALAAITYRRMAGIYEMIASSYSDRGNPIHKASAWLMTARAFIKSANLFRSASDMDNEIAMCQHAAYACIIATYHYHAAKASIKKQ